MPQIQVQKIDALLSFGVWWSLVALSSQEYSLLSKALIRCLRIGRVTQVNA